MRDDSTDGGRPSPAPGPTPAERARRLARARVDTMRSLGTVGAIGLSFALAILISALVGVWLDRLTGRSPIFLIIFFIVGVVAGVRNVILMSKRLR